MAVPANVITRDARRINRPKTDVDLMVMEATLENIISALALSGELPAMERHLRDALRGVWRARYEMKHPTEIGGQG